MRYLAVVSYRGTPFCGWQKQSVSKLPSVQEIIEKVLSRVLNKGTKIYGSGRTDAGVHALGQTFHFDSDKDLDTKKLINSMNKLLPLDVRILSLDKVSDEFHARFSAKGKTYIYKIRNSKISDPFTSDLEYTLGQKLDLDQMREASKLFEGKHNFQNFTSKEQDDEKFTRNIGEIDIKTEKDNIEISLTGNGFMRYMVRMIVGTLIQVGLGKMSIEEVKNNLENPVRRPSSHKAPAYGLYLYKVDY